MKAGSRYDGIFYLPHKCAGGINEVLIPIFFSFRAKRVEDENLVVADRFSPPGVEDIVLGKEIFLLREITTAGEVVLVKSSIERDNEGNILVKVNPKERILENRSFDRYAFCPEELGEFQVFKDEKEEPIGSAYITDISLSGAEFFSSTVPFSSINVGDVIVVKQKVKQMKLELVRKRENKARHVIYFAGKIVETNFNLMNYLMTNYVRVIKNILLANKF